jgi:sugar phosphate isomerase/epimerase
MKFAVRESMAPGSTITERFESLAKIGFEGIEIVGSSKFECVEEIKAAQKATGITPHIFSMTEGAILDARKEERDVAVRSIRDALTMCGECGGIGVIVPPLIHVKMQNRPRIPDLSPLAGTAKLERDLLTAILKEELAPHGEKVGAAVIIEPLNRYEQWWPCTLAHGKEICEAVNSPGVAMMADFFHMNIEDGDFGAAIRDAGKWIRNVHLASSQRVTPGHGHTDFRPGLKALQEIGYDDFYTFECGVPGDDKLAELKRAADFIGQQAKEA